MLAQITERQAWAISGADRFAIRLASDFAARCTALARAAHLDGTARLLGIRTRTLEFVVPSRSRDWEYSPVADFSVTVWCTCPAANHNRPCCHSGAVYAHLRQLAKACKEYAAD